MATSSALGRVANWQPLEFKDPRLEQQYLHYRSNHWGTRLGETLYVVVLTLGFLRNFWVVATAEGSQLAACVYVGIETGIWLVMAALSVYLPLQNPRLWSRLRGWAYLAQMGFVSAVSVKHYAVFFVNGQGGCARRFHSHLIAPLVGRVLFTMWAGLLQFQVWLLLLLLQLLMYGDWVSPHWHRGFMAQCTQLLEALPCGRDEEARVFGALQSRLCLLFPFEGCSIELSPLQQCAADRVFLYTLTGLLAIPLLTYTERRSRQAFLMLKYGAERVVPPDTFWLDATLTAATERVFGAFGTAMECVARRPVPEEVKDLLWWGWLLFCAPVGAVVGIGWAWAALCSAARERF